MRTGPGSPNRFCVPAESVGQVGLREAEVARTQRLAVVRECAHATAQGELQIQRVASPRFEPARHLSGDYPTTQWICRTRRVW